MNKTLLLLLLFFIPFINTGQNLQDELAKKMCDCFENEALRNRKALDRCYETVFFKNISEVYTHLNIESIEDPKVESFLIEVGLSVSKLCPSINELLFDPEQKKYETIVPKENLTCADFKNGDFYYVIKNTSTKQNDTTYVSIKDQMYLENFNKGKNYSLLDINWTNDCEFDLVFKHSNDVMKGTVSKPGDTYHYEVIDRTEQSLIIKLEWLNQSQYFEFFKRD